MIWFIPRKVALVLHLFAPATKINIKEFVPYPASANSDAHCQILIALPILIFVTTRSNICDLEDLAFTADADAAAVMPLLAIAY